MGTWYQFGRFGFDPEALLVMCGPTRLRLTPKAIDTLRVLVEHAGSLVSTETLMREIWPGSFVEEGSLARNISDLRKALGTRRGINGYIETIPKRGYRFVSPVRKFAGQEKKGEWTVAVLPFQAAGRASVKALGLELSEALVTKLIAIRGCDARLVTDAGKPHWADLVVGGEVRERNGTIRVHVRFSSKDGRSPVWAEAFEEQCRRSNALGDSIAEQLGGAVALWFGKRHRKPLARRYTGKTEAYQCYLRGHFHASQRSERGLKEAVRCFRQSLALDPEYALAYASLASTYALLPMLAPVEARSHMPRARAAALNALNIDETLADARAALAFVKWHYEWDWSGAEREFRRILRFHARDASTRQWYGLLLVEQGRFSEGIEQATRARRIDPHSPAICANLATVLHFAGRYDEAIKESRRALTLDPGSIRASVVTGLALERTGKVEDAIQHFQRALVVSPHVPYILGALGHAYGTIGKALEAARILRQLGGLPRATACSYAKCLVAAGIGQRRESLRWLETACDAREFQLVLLKVDRRLDSLRSDPAFRAISSRVGLTDQDAPSAA